MPFVFRMTSEIFFNGGDVRAHPLDGVYRLLAKKDGGLGFFA